MNFFNSLSNKNSNLDFHKTTANIYIGAAEAEGETTYNSKIKLAEVFEDFLNVFDQLNTEKFIITGRKGSGKSAIAEYMIFRANSESHVFADFIKTKDLQIEKIVQIGKEQEHEIQNCLIFEWLILTKLVKLLLDNQTIIDNFKSIKFIKNFLEVNRGFVNIDRNQVNEIIVNKNFEVDISPIKSYLSFKHKKEFSTKESKAPFYKLIPDLIETVQDLLKIQMGNESQYILIFDDLDIGFKESSEESINNIINILRTAKNYNIDIFGKQGFPVKIIILIRDDIKKIISKHMADSAKIFASYEIMLKWYDHNNFKQDENSVNLKKFINKRVEINFIINKIEYDEKDPWQTLVYEDPSREKTVFKHILDNTFFRPRDLILFFKPLPQNCYPLPIRFESIQKLLKTYKDEVCAEIKNELTASFNSEDITVIFKTIREINYLSNIRYDIILDKLIEYNLFADPHYTIYLLFEYSLIGNIDDSVFPTRFYFKHREERDESLALNRDLFFITHNVFNH